MSEANSTDAAARARPLRILIAEDNDEDLELTIRELNKSELDVEICTVSTREAFADKIRTHTVDMVLSDHRMPGWTGMDAFSEIVKSGQDIPLILVTGTLGDVKAVECIQVGMADYILKQQLARLPMAILRAQEAKLLRDAQKEAAAALREGEARFRLLVENAPDAIVVLDMDSGMFSDCNENALRLFRLTREELMLAGPGELSPPFQPDGSHSALAAGEWARRASSAQPCFGWTHRNSQGEEIPCEVRVVRLPSPARRLIRGSILDITERKRAEEALRESEARYRGLVNNATYGIYWVTLEGDLLDTNPALVQMLGYESIEELLAIDNTLCLYCDPAARERVATRYSEHERGDMTVEWKRKNGKIITVRLIGRRSWDVRRNSDCVEVIVEDVTEHIAMEKQLRQAQKFEAIGQLAGGIAHDFNNMIGAILGWAEIGLEETEAETRLHRHFDKVRHQAVRAAALTRQLLAFARRQILEPRNLDLNQNVMETLSLLEKVIGSNIEIKTKLAENLPLVRADPTQIDRVLMNLCINARDAMPAGGRLRIETGDTVFDEKYCAVHTFARPGHYTLLAVTDTGMGMDAATLDRIFEPFFTTKDTGKGSGLGLATVYGIVSQHGGFLHVYSEVGIGTTFRVYLPVTPSVERTPASVEDPRPARGGAETILIAEDHEGLRELARETLANLGYNILLACDGEEAVRVFQANRDRVDLLLLDVVLPKINGPEAYARISAEKADVPVIFATGYSPEMALLHDAQERGLTVLQKPYVPRELARRVRETLDRQPVKVHPG
ncbi:MAG TPA: response regulator [Candidatus Acidoferrales bacterium]|jgi:PAS domain S-box-containing protein|nr:response regulator [Candidatus Acidoferrales bacterium]